MAMAFVAGHTWTNKGVAAGTSVTLDLSVGNSPTVGNVVVIFVAQAANAQPSAPPAGWSSGGGASASTTSARGFIFFYKTWAAGDSTSWTCSRSSGVAWVAEALEVSGAEMVADGLSGQTATAALTKLTPSVTPTSAVERFAICGFVGANASNTWSGATITTTGAMTEVQDQAQTSIAVSLYYVDIASTTGSYVGTGTQTPNSAVGGASILLLRPVVQTARSGAATQAQVGAITNVDALLEAGAATQAQVGSVSETEAFGRSGAATQAQAAGIGETKTLGRAGAATQAQVGAISIGVTRGGVVTPRAGDATQAQAGGIGTIAVHPRAVNATQAQVGAITNLDRLLKTVAATQAQVGTVFHQVTRPPANATQAQSAALTRVPAHPRTANAAQPQSGALAIAATHPRAVGATQAQVGGITRTATHPRTTNATQAQTAAAFARRFALPATQAQVGGIVKGAAQTVARNAAQTQVGALGVLRIGRLDAATQTQVGALAIVPAHPRAVNATQAQVAGIVRIVVRPRTASASQAQVGGITISPARGRSGAATQDQLAAIILATLHARRLAAAQQTTFASFGGFLYTVSATQEQVAELLLGLPRHADATQAQVAAAPFRYIPWSGANIVLRFTQRFIIHIGVLAPPATMHLVSSIAPWAIHPTITVGGQAVNTVVAGNVVRLGCWVADTSGALVVPSSITLAVHDPTGAASNPTVVADANGGFHGDVVVPLGKKGTWNFRWATTGSYVAAAEGAFDVLASKFDT